MELLRRFEKSGNQPTPLGVKIGVFVLGLLIALRARSALTMLAQGTISIDAIVTLASVAIYGVLLYAYWNMKRWAIVSLAALIAFGAVRTLIVYGGTERGMRAAIVAILIEAACVVPGFLAMRRA